ncbi:hypothetical protein BLA29_004514, partial [Euroglyphus maynei]
MKHDDDSSHSMENQTTEESSKRHEEVFPTENIDHNQYVFQKSHSERIGQYLNEILPSISKKEMNLEKLFRNYSDPFGIVESIYEELDKHETNPYLHSFICEFSQLIEIFTQQARIDQIFIPTNNVFINDVGILSKYLNLFLNEMIQINHSNLQSNNDATIALIFILFAQKIVIHNLKNSTTNNLLTIEKLIDSIPYHFAFLLQNNTATVQSKSQLQCQSLALLIIGMIEMFDGSNDNQHDDLEKFSKLLETILICQIKYMDLLYEFFRPDLNQYDDDGDENDYKILESLLCQLY